MAFRLDRATISPPVRRADGSVVYEGPLTRTGVFVYRQPDGSIRREYRPPAEVGHQDSLATLELAHVCDDHPAERGQAKSKSVGAVGAVRFDGKNVIAKVMVRDDAVNAKIANGKRQISCGYDCVLVETPGVSPEGEPYDAIQTCHDAEHVAIVMAGRSGPEYGLRLDALEPEVNKWLNDRLRRTEFMPFAPATLHEYRHQCYLNVDGADFTNNFFGEFFGSIERQNFTIPLEAVSAFGTVVEECFLCRSCGPGICALLKVHSMLNRSQSP